MYTFKLRRGTAVRWALTNPILDPGEPGHEVDTGNFRIGDGLTRWVDLPVYLTEEAVREAIRTAIDEAGASSGEDSPTTLFQHVNDPTPHSAYDDGPSLLLLYQNAKV